MIRIKEPNYILVAEYMIVRLKDGMHDICICIISGCDRAETYYFLQVLNSSFPETNDRIATDCAQCKITGSYRTYYFQQANKCIIGALHLLYDIFAKCYLPVMVRKIIFAYCAAGLLELIHHHTTLPSRVLAFGATGCH